MAFFNAQNSPAWCFDTLFIYLGSMRYYKIVLLFLFLQWGKITFFVQLFSKLLGFYSLFFYLHSFANFFFFIVSEWSFLFKIIYDLTLIQVFLQWEKTTLFYRVKKLHNLWYFVTSCRKAGIDYITKSINCLNALQLTVLYWCSWYCIFTLFFFFRSRKSRNSTPFLCFFIKNCVFVRVCSYTTPSRKITCVFFESPLVGLPPCYILGCIGGLIYKIHFVYATLSRKYYYNYLH